MTVERVDPAMERATEIASMLSPHRNRLEFRAPAEIALSARVTEPALWDGYLYPGTLTVLSGPPKVGKSTLIFDLARAFASGETEFLGRALQGGPVVLVSEEGDRTVYEKLEGAGDDLRVLSRDAALPRPSWLSLVMAAIAEADRVSAKVVIVDTFAFWGALRGDREQSSGDTTEALSDLMLAAKRLDAAVLMSHHNRKSGGEIGEAMRGSSAISGMADVLVEVGRLKGGRDSQRVVTALGRFAATPASLLVERMSDGGWRAEERDTQATGKHDEPQMRVQLLEAISAADEPLTLDQLTATLRIGKSSILGPLNAVLADGEIEQLGLGVRGDPKRFQIPSRTESNGNGVGNDQEAVSVSVPTPLKSRTETETSNGKTESRLTQ